MIVTSMERKADNLEDFDLTGYSLCRPKRQSSICFGYSENSDLQLALALSTSIIDPRINVKRKKQFPTSTSILSDFEWKQVMQERASEIIINSFASNISNEGKFSVELYYWKLTTNSILIEDYDWQSNFSLNEE